MSHRRDQKEQLRREREERERQAREAAQRKRMVGIGAGGALALIAVIVVVVLVVGGGDDAGGGGQSGDGSALWPAGGSVPDLEVTDLAQAAEAAGCELRSAPVKSRSHVDDPDLNLEYGTNPPTGGRHFVEPADDGVYDEAPSDEELVHTMEHGRVIVWVKPTIPADQRADIRAVIDDDDYQMVLVPRRNMSQDVALTAWSRDPEPNGTGQLMVCPSYDPAILDAIRDFRDEHRSKGPEPIP